MAKFIQFSCFEISSLEKTGCCFFNSFVGRRGYGDNTWGGEGWNTCGWWVYNFVVLKTDKCVLQLVTADLALIVVPITTSLRLSITIMCSHCGWRLLKCSTIGMMNRLRLNLTSESHHVHKTLKSRLFIHFLFKNRCLYNSFDARIVWNCHVQFILSCVL